MDKVRKIYFGQDSLITALGSKEETLASMDAGRSGLVYNESYGMMAGAVDRTQPLARMHEGCTYFESLVLNNLLAVLQHSGLKVTDNRLLVILSTTKGNINKLSESTDPIPEEAYLGTTAEKIQDRLQLAHLPWVISNACISGVSALIIAREVILQDRYDHVIVVGCDTLNHFVTEGFASFKSISEQPCRPYDASRNGLTLGEACGAVLVTCDQQYAVQPAIYLAGGAITNDANHISGPSRTGDGLFCAIDRALAEAGLQTDDIGFVNAHGTATVYNDEMESKAISWAGLQDKPMNSFKSYIGHTLGASGVVETILCLQELRAGKIYGTPGFTELGTSCPLQVSPAQQTFTAAAFVKTASGFGGCNAAIVVSLHDSGQPVHFSDSSLIREVAQYSLPYSSEPFHDFIRAEYKKLGESNMKFYKMSDLCKAAYVAMAHLTEEYSLDRFAPEDISIVLANRSSSLETDAEHQRIIDRHLDEGASPAVFVYTLPNVVTGELCIRHHIKGNNTFFIENTDSGLAEAYARLLLSARKTRAVICGWCEKYGESWKVEIKLLIQDN